jgi:hypothetical protein
LKKFAFQYKFRLGRLQSRTGSGPSGKPEDPCRISTEAMGFPSFRAIHADVLKGMNSYRIGFSECKHGRASAMASMPGRHSLPSLSRLAKGKIHTNSPTGRNKNFAPNPGNS